MRLEGARSGHLLLSGRGREEGGRGGGRGFLGGVLGVAVKRTVGTRQRRQTEAVGLEGGKEK